MKPVITNIKTTLFGKIAAVLVGLFVVTIPFAIGQTTTQESLEDPISAEVAVTNPVAELNAQIEENRKKLEELHNQLVTYENSANQANAKVHDIQTQIEAIDSDIAHTDFLIALNQKEIDTLELEMKALQGQIDEKNTAISTQKDRLSEAVRQLDQNSRTSTLAVLVRNKSLSDFYGQAQAVASISQSLQDAIGNLSRLKDDLEAKQNQLNTKRDDVQQTKLQMEVQKDSTIAQRDLKEDLLSSAIVNEANYEELVKKFADEEQRANATITALEQEVQQRLSGIDPSEFQFNPSSFIWPVQGPITAYFKDPTYPFRKSIGEHFGLDIATAQGTPVRAASDGVIATIQDGGSYIDAKGRIVSLLNWVSICHDEECNLKTRYLHLSQVSVVPFQMVKQGQVIGLSGGARNAPGSGAGLSSGPHLHFEIREEAFPVDPLKYLP